MVGLQKGFLLDKIEKDGRKKTHSDTSSVSNNKLSGNFESSEDLRLTECKKQCLGIESQCNVINSCDNDFEVELDDYDYDSYGVKKTWEWEFNRWWLQTWTFRLMSKCLRF